MLTSESYDCTFQHRHLTLAQLSVKCGGYVILCRLESTLTYKNQQSQRFAQSGVKHLVFVSMSKHKEGRGNVEFLSSGSPQGLSSPMLVVIFLSCHCSLLCSPSFLIILSAIYQTTMKSERTKKEKKNIFWTCRFFAFMAYVKFFGGKMFCVFSLSVPYIKKKSLLSVEIIQIIFVLFFFFFVSFKFSKIFQ